ncbi:tRNA preQ1(34) S-adenosylmethionine ribosyltransferase-isomerase QueA [Polyangium sp. y55x31]|uniref:tRNA preQ1(34) S-adenosylmethionine ribosyltransferase-isomerase QueA n=1 Tax=Polyangium sp. y55x31 TaxID=3042688 RepID=UPI0024823751|nr:tRNA preQ1(34) S-adenosylmethionine ribosyltransferase-isomerase QueA [Polyangium sp. y55x31]MDI1481531.1 tRNA preQ1(34) S-adenosylmethionine ribosyltransferase-isomerase QueA [Polyangium sp. y55x31]
MRRDLLTYELPPELIAAHPSPDRESARLLVVDDEPGRLEHESIRDLPDRLPEGALVVVNDTRVLPARLLGRKATSGGKVEIFLVRKVAETHLDRSGERLPAERWRALGRSSKPLREGTEITIDGPVSLVARIEGRDGGFGGEAPLAGAKPPSAERGLFDVVLFSPEGRSVPDAVDAAGHVPLPPYIRRDDDAADRARYQTVYAREPGAVAAPTAGLHLTEPLIERFYARGMELARVTLHVGLGTFQPVTVSDLDDHPMHAEAYRVPPETAEAVARARREGREIVAIGTTSVRALESAADPEREGYVVAREGETRLLIQPGYRFRVVDRLLTNFHLPESTLLALVSAFAGLPRILESYRVAIEEKYRFYSYGDAMLLRRSR